MKPNKTTTNATADNSAQSTADTVQTVQLFECGRIITAPVWIANRLFMATSGNAILPGQKEASVSPATFSRAEKLKARGWKLDTFELLRLGNVASRRFMLAGEWCDWKGSLTQSQRAALLALFGHGCRRETVARLARCFDDDCARVRPCGLLDRVSLEEIATEGREQINGFSRGFPVESVSYCAGQDYPAEIREVRQILIASY